MATKLNIVITLLLFDNWQPHVMYYMWIVWIWWLYRLFVSCFDRFFRHVNLKENKLISKRRGGFFMDDLNLIGVDYLWRVTYLLFLIFLFLHHIKLLLGYCCYASALSVDGSRCIVFLDSLSICACMHEYLGRGILQPACRQLTFVFRLWYLNIFI